MDLTVRDLLTSRRAKVEGTLSRPAAVSPHEVPSEIARRENQANTAYEARRAAEKQKFLRVAGSFASYAADLVEDYASSRAPLPTMLRIEADLAAYAGYYLQLSPTVVTGEAQNIWSDILVLRFIKSGSPAPTRKAIEDLINASVSPHTKLFHPPDADLLLARIKQGLAKMQSGPQTPAVESFVRTA